MSGCIKDQEIQTLVSALEGPLIRYTVRIVRDEERARDVVQDAFLSLCDQEPQLLEGLFERDEVRPWLFRVCRNRAIDLYRREHRMTHLHETQEKVFEPQQTPSQQVEQKETLHSIFGCLETLPEKQRDVIYLKFQGGLSYKEIAEVTGLSVTNVGVLLHSALKRLREQLHRLNDNTPTHE